LAAQAAAPGESTQGVQLDMLTRTDIPRREVPFLASELIAPRKVSRIEREVDNGAAVVKGAVDWPLVSFRDTTLEQSELYCSLRWPRLHEVGPIIRVGGTIRAQSQVLTCSLPFIGGGLAYVKFGPVWRKPEESTNPIIYKNYVELLVEEYCYKRGLLLTIQPRPHPTFQDEEVRVLTELGFSCRRQSADPSRYLVQLNVSPDQLLKSMSQTWRRNLKLAQSQSLSISEETGPAAITAFQMLHRDMVARKNAAGSDPVDILPQLCSELPADLKPHFVIARKDGVPVAGAVVTRHGDIAYYLYGASSSDDRHLRAGYALQWWIIQSLSNSGVQYYDLGGTVGCQGLRQFKQGLTGKQGIILEMPGEYDYAASWHARWKGRSILTLRELRRASERLSAKVLPR
jgi:hypothetical protein